MWTMNSFLLLHPFLYTGSNLLLMSCEVSSLLTGGTKRHCWKLTDFPCESKNNFGAMIGVIVKCNVFRFFYLLLHDVLAVLSIIPDICIERGESWRLQARRQQRFILTIICSVPLSVCGNDTQYKYMDILIIFLDCPTSSLPMALLILSINTWLVAG